MSVWRIGWHTVVGGVVSQFGSGTLPEYQSMKAGLYYLRCPKYEEGVVCKNNDKYNDEHSPYSVF